MTDIDTTAAVGVSEGGSPSLQHANGHSIEQERSTTGIARTTIQTEEDVKEDQSEAIMEEKLDEAGGDAKPTVETTDDDETSDEGKCRLVLSFRKNSILTTFARL
jgi:hypothetical protein